MTTQRAVILVFDSCGTGEAPDAAEYGDVGSDTLGHTAEANDGLKLPTLQAAGLGNLHPNLKGVPQSPKPTMAFGRMQTASVGKDSTTGHWEIAGLITEVPHGTFTETGFPTELISSIEDEAGISFIGNVAASGTEIIERLGPDHLSTGCPILYTSADSVLQIAAHTDIIALERLYEICRISRHHADRYRIGRVIARPFTGEPGSFVRTYDRQDFSMPPHAPTVLDQAEEAGLSVIGIGKIEDLFAGRGLTESIHTNGDANGLETTLTALAELDRSGIIFTNLVDLDMLYGHREDPKGYAEGLSLIDSYLPHLLDVLTPNDLLIITADHGNDPTDGSTDHTRENVPLLASGLNAAGVDLGIRSQFSDVAATVSEYLGLANPSAGTSFLDLIR